jgi:hypothetical protein
MKCMLLKRVIVVKHVFFVHKGKVTTEAVFMFMSVGWDDVSELWPQTGLLFSPRWYEYGETWWNNFRRKNLSTWRQTCPSATSSTTIPHGLIRAWTRVSEVRGRRLTAWATALPTEATLLSQPYTCFSYVQRSQIPLFFELSRSHSGGCLP